MARPQNDTAAISPAQNKKIWASARSLHMDSDMLHGLAMMMFGKDSLRKLTGVEAGRMIEELGRREKGQSDFRYVVAENGKPRPLATKGQLWKIDELVEELGWTDNPKRLQGFCRKYSKVDNPLWLTRQQAWKLIEGLKKLLEKSSGDK